MIGLDTNVVVRYLVQDDPKQSIMTNHLIDRAKADKETLVISQVTLCEIVWVLEQCYRIKKQEIITVLKQLLQTKQIKIENDVMVRHSLQDFEHHAAVDFSDCLIGRQNVSNGCAFTYTFDKNAAKKLHATFREMR